MSDDFLFAEDTEEEIEEQRESWKILVVDDEPEVHAVTKLALSDFVFQEKKLEFISAHSGAEAKEMFRTHNDIAVVLLDVVMETDDAGLKVAEFIRNEANNYFTRIILRTGQPGQAPEKDVIVNYDINDYKSKTELTAQKLFTVVIATLRSYRDIISIEESRKGLEKIISASADLFSIHSLENFIDGIIQQLSSLLGGTADAAYITSAVGSDNGRAFSRDIKDFVVFSGRENSEEKIAKPLKEVMSEEVLGACKKALSMREVVYSEDYVVAYCQSNTEPGSLLYLSGLPRVLNANDKHLIELFATNVQIAFENVLLTKDVEDTQKEILNRVGQAMECQLSGGRHIQRMTILCELLAREYGLAEDEVEVISLAVPLHDIGKLKVPVEILTKPSELTQDEIAIVKQHAEAGYELLKDSDKPIIQTAALLAKQHHERWDGSGYPDGLSGSQINIYSRIAAIADVYDALRGSRCYKEPWPVEKVVEKFQQERGRQFDPNLVDVLLNNINKFEAVIFAYPDSEPQFKVGR
ncbi:MAG: DUF3369 domain-containing protein [Aestuariibacter sp.]